eukprot:CAMPEP_0174703158 /NCGR_PEP_ID=MMETSP1094-20130205/7207_1 /TAXON_ID=156173 /ORGANISM="Chrysochromulina brevifilum, Strain UTEX LB 985" /LENGTH=43 /DNA_ID= /DNA_START= /DNA_END= /DNA_ORIENTATION=
MSVQREAKPKRQSARRRRPFHRRALPASTNFAATALWRSPSAP